MLSQLLDNVSDSKMKTKSRQILFSLSHLSPPCSRCFAIPTSMSPVSLTYLWQTDLQLGLFLIVSLPFSECLTVEFVYNQMDDRLHNLSLLQCSGNIKLFHSPCQIQGCLHTAAYHFISHTPSGFQ